jgi:hypothetical protein
MQGLHAPDWSTDELSEAERQVALTNALIELQRLLLEYLYQTGGDITSAKTVFDSLLVDLASRVARRHRLRTMLNIGGPQQAA